MPKNNLFIKLILFMGQLQGSLCHSQEVQAWKFNLGICRPNQIRWFQLNLPEDFTFKTQVCELYCKQDGNKLSFEMTTLMDQKYSITTNKVIGLGGYIVQANSDNNIFIVKDINNQILVPAAPLFQLYLEKQLEGLNELKTLKQNLFDQNTQNTLVNSIIQTAKESVEAVQSIKNAGAHSTAKVTIQSNIFGMNAPNTLLFLVGNDKPTTLVILNISSVFENRIDTVIKNFPKHVPLTPKTETVSVTANPVSF